MPRVASRASERGDLRKPVAPLEADPYSVVASRAVLPPSECAVQRHEWRRCTRSLWSDPANQALAEGLSTFGSRNRECSYAEAFLPREQPNPSYLYHRRVFRILLVGCIPPVAAASHFAMKECGCTR